MQRDLSDFDAKLWMMMCVFTCHSSARCVLCVFFGFLFALSDEMTFLRECVWSRLHHDGCDLCLQHDAWSRLHHDGCDCVFHHGMFFLFRIPLLQGGSLIGHMHQLGCSIMMV